MKKAFLILGAPRSGTSVVSHMISMFGIDFGNPENFLDTREEQYQHNPIFYELQWVNDYNDKIVAQLGGKWYEDILPIEKDFDNPEIKEIEKKLQTLIKSEWNDKQSIGIKDPRFCITFPIWENVISKMGYKLELIFVTRYLGSCLKSNYKLTNTINNWSEKKLLRFWLQQSLGAKYFTRNYNVYFVSYDNVVHNPLAEAEKIALNFDFDLDLAINSSQVVDRSWYHHNEIYKTDNFFVDNCYRSLNEDKLSPYEYLKYRSICLLFKQEIKDAERAINLKEEQTFKLQSQVQQIQVELEQSQVLVQQTQTELDNSQSQLQQTQTELERSQSQLQHTQAELQDSRSHIQQIQTELERSQSQLQHTQAELDNSQSQLQHTQLELQRSQALVQQTETELERSQSQLHQTQTELERSQSQLHQTQTELTQSQTMISAMESSKFWKLRTVWFRFKQTVGFTETSFAETTNLPANVNIPGVTNIREINFKAPDKDTLTGCFDGINGSNTTTITLPESKPLSASGWAIITEEGRPADRVLITYGKHNSLVAIATVNLERPDVVKAFNNPTYKNCGWTVIFNASNLPAGKVVFKAWAYNATRKEAVLLNSVRSNLHLKSLLSRAKYYYAVLRVRGIRYSLAKLFLIIYSKLNKAQSAIGIIPDVTTDEPYAKWLSKNFPREADLLKMAETVEILPYKPLISVIVPVFNTPEQFLRQAIESVLNQVYPYWELCIADDASTKSCVKSVLEEYISKDSRIKVVFRNNNGHISRASNSAIEIATGEFVTLLDHDDLLTPDALYEVALMLNRHPEADMIYSDEDKIDEQNQLKEPFFKPDWCPDSFLSRMYTCHLGTYRRSLINEIGGFRAGYEGSQDYDLVLRFTEKTENIFHIPKILYHWRIHSASTASSLDTKTYAIDAAKKALSDAIDRRGEAGVVAPAPGPIGYYVIRYCINTEDLVTIIIPTKNLGSIVDNCLTSIFEKTTYPNYEVILIDNGSTEQTTLDVIRKWKDKEPNRFKCYSLDIPFNYSKINNFAVKQSQGKYLLFLNNDTEVITPDWIEAMVEQAQRPSIGAVGALLLYPDNTIQHAGVVAGVGGVANHCHKHLTFGSPGYFNHLNTVNNFSSITAACMMCRREAFEEVGGFEEELAVAFNDVDLCFKLVEKGYRNIYLPHVVLYHYESKSRGIEDTPEKLNRFLKENEYMHSKWKNIIKNDPCYNLNLSKIREDYSIEI